jgi:glycosyltransferase involved in cell wall biosynthesis
MAKILVLSNMFPPHHYGGYELSCRDVVDRWRAAGHDVTVLTSTMRVAGVADPPDEREAGVWRDLPIAYREGQLVAPPLHKRLAIEKENQRVLAATVEAVKPDVVSIWHVGALSIGLLTTLDEKYDVPLVYVICDDWPTYAHKIDPWMKLWYRFRPVADRVEGMLGVPTHPPDVGRSGTFCFISRFNRDTCLKLSPWRFDDSTITWNGIDHRDFPVLGAVPERPWRWRMVNAGRLDPRKGLETAVRALAELPAEATLELLPSVDDAYREHLEQVARELGVHDRLSFVMVTRAELRDRYAGADVCVFPTEWPEPFGLVPLEAMACGTPVVATGSGGSGEFLLHETNCLRIPIADPSALAAAVRRLADDPELRRRRVTAGFAAATELSVDRLATVLEEWHLAAADRFAGGRPPDRVLDVSA